MVRAFLLLVLLPATGCSGKESGACAQNSDCPSGRYCASGTCTFDCREDVDCGSPELVCDDRGRCVPHGGDADTDVDTDTDTDTGTGTDTATESDTATDTESDTDPRPACDEQYGDASGYVNCSEDADTCEFNLFTDGNTSCRVICGRRGGECISAHDNTSCVDVGAEEHCRDYGPGTTLCACTRGCGLGRACSWDAGEHCVDGVCEDF